MTIDKSVPPADQRPPVPDFAPVPRKPRHDGWTPARQRAFIAALADTGSVSRAARWVNMSPEGAYYLRRQPGSEGFRRAWEAALDFGVQRLKDIAYERAIDGQLSPVFVAGSRDPYAKFRLGDFNLKTTPTAVRFTGAWTFPSDVQPLFPVPSCVLFAVGESLPRRLPAKVLRHSGHLPMRDATPEMADANLQAWEDNWPADTGVSASPYREKFRQGATLVPRRLVIVEREAAQGRLGINSLAPIVRGRTSSQDKMPWKVLEPLRGPVEVEFLRPVYLGESIAPYRVLSHVTGVIPWNANKREVMDKEGAYSIGKRLLAEWLTKAEALWVEHGTGGMSLRERWDYGRSTFIQFPPAKIRVLFAASGTQPAATKLLNDPSGIAEHKLYWLGVKTHAEADYLIAILNSETARAAAEQWQSEGQWGKRDFDKAVFNLPIPLFEPANPLHTALAKAAVKSEKLAALVELKEGEHFTRSRKRIRQALIANGVAGKIEALVAELIGVAPFAILPRDDAEPEEADAD